MSTAKVTRRPFTKCPASFLLKVSSVNTAKLVKGGELITDLDCDNLNGEFILNYSPCSSGPRGDPRGSPRYQDELVWHTGCGGGFGGIYETAYVSIDVPEKLERIAGNLYRGVTGIRCGDSYKGLFTLKSPTQSSCYSKAVWVSTSQKLLVDGSKQDYFREKACSFYDAIPLGLDSALNGLVSKPICGGNSVWSIKYLGGQWSLFAGGEVYPVNSDKVSPAIYTIFDSRGSKINMESFVMSPAGTKATAKLTQVNAGGNWPDIIPMKLQVDPELGLSVISNTPIWTLSNQPDSFGGSDRFWVLKPRSNIGYPYYQSVSPANPDEICDGKTLVMQLITVPRGSKSSVSWCVNAPDQVTLKATCGGSGLNKDRIIPRSGTTGLVRNDCGCVCDIDIIDNRIGSCTCNQSGCLGYCDDYSQSRIECKFPRSLDQCTMCIEDTAPCAYTAVFGCEVTHEGWSIASSKVTLRKDCSFQPEKCTWYAVGPSLSSTGEGGTGAQPIISGDPCANDGGCYWSGWGSRPVNEGPAPCQDTVFGDALRKYTFEFDWPETRADQIASTITRTNPCPDDAYYFPLNPSPASTSFQFGSGDACSNNYYVGASTITSHASRCRMKSKTYDISSATQYKAACYWEGYICGFACDFNVPYDSNRSKATGGQAQPLGDDGYVGQVISSGVICAAYLIERTITGGGYYLVFRVMGCGLRSAMPNRSSFPNGSNWHYYKSTKVLNSILDLAEPITCNLIRKEDICVPYENVPEGGAIPSDSAEKPVWHLRGIPQSVSMIPTLMIDPCSATSLLCDNPQNKIEYGSNTGYGPEKACWYTDPTTINGFSVEFMGTSFSFDSYVRPVRLLAGGKCYENQYRRLPISTWRTMWSSELKEHIYGDFSSWFSCNVLAKCDGFRTFADYYNPRLENASFFASAQLSFSSYMDPRPWHASSQSSYAGGYWDFSSATLNVGIYEYPSRATNQYSSAFHQTAIAELKAALSLSQDVYPDWNGNTNSCPREDAMFPILYPNGNTAYGMPNSYCTARGSGSGPWSAERGVFSAAKSYYLKNDSWTESHPSLPSTYTERNTHAFGSYSGAVDSCMGGSNVRFRTHAEIKLPSTLTIS